ncbi:MAG: NrfD/PsrC family molybdoenzyme membrane anchor subunit [Caldilineaceae bacterium]
MRSSIWSSGLCIGHAGTLISAILLLFRQNWRTAFSRFAEAMTLFALACAGLFPIFHLGRPWLAFWLAPYPNVLNLWPQWRSPLVWDFFAISTYTLVSALFWFVGLIPDLAAMKDRAKSKAVKMAYAMLSMGWRGDSLHWTRYQMIYVMLAALATPLVISVHSIIGMDFAASILPGWRHTVFPPYFVAGAIFSGLAMVIILAVPIRAAYKLHDLITDRHIDMAAKLMLVSGSVWPTATRSRSSAPGTVGTMPKCGCCRNVSSASMHRFSGACSSATSLSRSCFGSARFGATCRR